MIALMQDLLSQHFYKSYHELSEQSFWKVTKNHIFSTTLRLFKNGDGGI